MEPPIWIEDSQCPVCNKHSETMLDSYFGDKQLENYATFYCKQCSFLYSVYEDSKAEILGPMSDEDWSFIKD